MAGAKQYINTPVGPLEWVFVNGKGKKDKRSNTGRHIFTAQVVLDPENKPAHQEFIDSVHTFWKENRPAGIKKSKSLGIYDHQVPTDEKDEDGDTIYRKTGLKTVMLSTDTKYRDGKPKKITIRNKSGGEIHLGDKRIGNGSRGRLGGSMYIYENGGEAGVTMFLDELQLTKFVEFKREMGAVEDDEVSDDEDDGFDLLTGSVAASSTDNTSTEDANDNPPANQDAAKALADNISGL